jgi:hypothetical protein
VPVQLDLEREEAEAEVADVEAVQVVVVDRVGAEVPGVSGKNTIGSRGSPVRKKLSGGGAGMGCRRLMHLLPLPIPVEVGKPRRTVAHNPKAPIAAFSGEAEPPSGRWHFRSTQQQPRVTTF